jgi:CRP/FNR family transcriptional regulator
MDKVEALRRTAMFRDLGTSELNLLASRAVERRLSRGDVLFTAGEPARGMYVVVEGAVRASRESSEGREQVIHVERAGATFAEVPMFDDGDYPSTVIADEETILLFLSKQDFRAACLQQPAIPLAAARVLAGRLRKTASLIETLSLRDVDRRLARLLLQEGETSGKQDGHRVSMELSLTHQQIGARIGSVREVVSRAFARLQQHGLVQVDGRTVVLPDERLVRAYVME